MVVSAAAVMTTHAARRGGPTVLLPITDAAVIYLPAGGVARRQHDAGNPTCSASNAAGYHPADEHAIPLLRRLLTVEEGRKTFSGHVWKSGRSQQALTDAAFRVHTG